MSTHLLLIDFNNLYFRGLHALPEFNYGPTYTTGLYGFLTQLAKHVNDFEPNFILLCNDHPPYLRKAFFPDYKSMRVREKDDKMTKVIQEGRNLCNEFISLTGLPTWRVPGYEADDLMALICETYSNLRTKIRIISNDSDLYQLFRYPNIEIVGKKKYTRTDFNNDYPNLSPLDWPKYTALVGSHNDVPGVRGIGKVTAKKILSNNDSWKKIYEEHKDLLNRNIHLSTLPLNGEGPPPPSLKYMEGMSKYNEREIMTYLFKNGITITKNMAHAFNIIKG